MVHISQKLVNFIHLMAFSETVPAVCSGWTIQTIGWSHDMHPLYVGYRVFSLIFASCLSPLNCHRRPTGGPPVDNLPFTHHLSEWWRWSLWKWWFYLRRRLPRKGHGFGPGGSWNCFTVSLLMIQTTPRLPTSTATCRRLSVISMDSHLINFSWMISILRLV